MCGIKRQMRGVASLDAIIIFIVVVVVSGFVGLVLLETSSGIQQRTTAQAGESRKDVSAGVEVINVVGTDASTNDPGGTPHALEDIYVTFRLLPGNVDMILNTTMINIEWSGYDQSFSYNATCQSECPGATGHGYNVFYLNYPQSPVPGHLRTGEVVRASLKLNTPLTEEKEVKVSLMSVHGTMTQVKFNTPQNMVAKRQGLWPLS